MGRGSFFVPAEATAMTLKVRSHKRLPPNPITVDGCLDDRQLTVIHLPDPRRPDPDEWVNVTVPRPRGQTSRHLRRVDVRVRHWLESPSWASTSAKSSCTSAEADQQSEGV